MALECIVGMTGRDMKGSGSKTRSGDSELIHGWTGGNTKENGLTIIWKASVFTRGRMEEYTRANIGMTKSMDLAFTLGLTEDSIKECGSRASSTV